ncbi:MAG: DUF5053 domain-containing protein [Bacteroidaceae bacterium]|nr:DUF5053 domain-containing protein [Bacteroidaceae bacterium]
MEELVLTKSDVKRKLSGVLMLISWREFSRRYFGKSSSWLYHKLDGISEFTEEERLQMKTYLRSMAQELQNVADAI